MGRWLAQAWQYATRREGPTGPSPLATGAIAMAVAWAIAWWAGLAVAQAVALGLAALLAGVVVVSIRARRRRRAERVARRRPADGDLDFDEVIIQDATSGRTWHLGEVYFLGAAEKRRLEAERPNVWKAYRACLLRGMAVPPVVPD